jgi:protein-disulfide isomerase
MKKLVIILSIFFLASIFVFGQNGDQVLGRANGFSFTVNDLFPTQLRDAFAQMNETIAKKRQESLEVWIGEMLIETEAKSKKILVNNLLNVEVYRKVLNPTEAQIKQLFEENKSQLGDVKIENIRERLVKYLRQENEQKAYLAFIDKLKAKYKPNYFVDINSPKLKQTDVLVSVNGTQILNLKYEEKVNPSLFDLRLTLFEQTKNSIVETAYTKFVIAEAASQNLATEDYLRREISDKMVDYSDSERNRLRAFLQDKLFQKYKFEFLLKEPTAPVQKIDTSNAFTKGNVNAKVTVVMFTDFQCSACAATHPIVQEVLNEYGENIRFVVRNLPLVNIHANAYKAAQAGQAARSQGKFLEYIEILYKNQDKLDAVSLKKYASSMGLNVKQFELEMNSRKFEELIKKDIADGIFYGISSTPTIFVNGVKLRDLSTSGLKQAIVSAENSLKK